MMRLINALRALRPVVAAALVAMLVGAGGFAYAQQKLGGGQIAANAINTKHLVNNAVTKSKLQKGLRRQVNVARALAGRSSVPDTVGHLIHVEDGTEQVAHLSYELDQPVALEELEELSFFQELVHGTGNFGANVILGVDLDGDGYEANDMAWHIGTPARDPETLGDDAFLSMDGLHPANEAKVDATEVAQWWAPNAAGDGTASGPGCGYNQVLADFVANCDDGAFASEDEVAVIRLVLGGSSSWNDIAVRLTTSIDGEMTPGLFEE